MEQSNDDRKIFEYKGFNCVSAFFKGKHAGKISHQGKVIVRLEGDSIPHVIEEIKETIDRIENIYHLESNSTFKVEQLNQLLVLVDQNNQKLNTEESNQLLSSLTEFISLQVSFYEKLTESKHREFLRSKNIENAEDFEIRRSQESHRKTHCYNCKTSLDNYIDYECTSCGWIICSCGACGCGFDFDYFD